MIRNVVLFSVKAGTRPEQLDAIVRAMKALRFEGCRRWELVRDLNLREGTSPTRSSPSSTTRPPIGHTTPTSSTTGYAASVSVATSA